MQGYRQGLAPFIAVLVISIACGLIVIVAHEEDAALLLCLLAGGVLGFVFPGGAWRWALVLALWIPVALLIKSTPNPAYVWCPDQLKLNQDADAVPAPAWTLVLSPFIAVYIGVALDWFVSEGLRWLEFLHWRWFPLVKPALRLTTIALAAVIVLGASLMLAQPLRPYSIGNSYCWDEYCFAVVSVKRVKTIGSGSHRAVARGTFYIVTADMETPWWGRFIWSNDAVYVTDYAGTDYRYSLAGQRASDTLTNSNRSACHEILGAGETETIVFDLPSNVVQPRLLVRNTLGFEGLLGGVRSNLLYIKPAFNLRYD